MSTLSATLSSTFLQVMVSKINISVAYYRLIEDRVYLLHNFRLLCWIHRPTGMRRPMLIMYDSLAMFSLNQSTLNVRFRVN